MELSQEQLATLQDVDLDEMESYTPVVRYGSFGDPEVTLAYLRSSNKKRNDLTFNRLAVDLMKFEKDAYHVAFKFGVPDMLIVWSDPPKNEPQFVLGNRTDGKSDKALKFSNKIFCEDVIQHFNLEKPREGKLLQVHFNITEYSGKYILTIKNKKVL